MKAESFAAFIPKARALMPLRSKYLKTKDLNVACTFFMGTPYSRLILKSMPVGNIFMALRVDTGQRGLYGVVVAVDSAYGEMGYHRCGDQRHP
jgi:hypothetical protein